MSFPISREVRVRYDIYWLLLLWLTSRVPKLKAGSLNWVNMNNSVKTENFHLPSGKGPLKMSHPKADQRCRLKLLAQ